MIKRRHGVGRGDAHGGSRGGDVEITQTKSVSINDDEEFNEAEGENRSTEIVQIKYHFLKAEVDEEIYFLDDAAHVKAEEEKENYMCKIVELFQAVNGKQPFSTQCDANANSIPHVFPEIEGQYGERNLLDMYSGCGGMSVGLCLSANSCGVKLVTKWVVDSTHMLVKA
ncbi:hypothetical protein SASPL_154586 [Salvia splendens]|uniref:DNA (Cytosine-5)-methyltransferase 1 n=1 Tax=Salvia splendens TaxID=180675 RepID=A0A8X8YZE4_SALSN|nr:hypothetical protein SASPL_154586 [Salvia splendens]